jgi:hypothetical protein
MKIFQAEGYYTINPIIKIIPLGWRVKYSAGAWTIQRKKMKFVYMIPALAAPIWRPS